jgi:hypothetical protein
MAGLLHDGRDWSAVTDFYSRLVVGDADLSTTDLGLVQPACGSCHASQAQRAVPEASPGEERWKGQSAEPRMQPCAVVGQHEQGQQQLHRLPSPLLLLPQEQQQRQAPSQAGAGGKQGTQQDLPACVGDFHSSALQKVEQQWLAWQEHHAASETASAHQRPISDPHQQEQQTPLNALAAPLQPGQDRRQQRQLRKRVLGGTRITFRVALSYFGPAFQVQ